MGLHAHHSTGEMDGAAAALRTALHLHQRESAATVTGAARPVRPFVTVSRPAGAAGRSFGRLLVDRLNRVADGARWSCWDQELVEKVSAEHDIEASIVAQLEDRRHTWVHEFLQSLPSLDERHHPDEFKVYRRVAITVRALAENGHAVIVGRGGAFLAAGLPGGVHVRIVAPLARRIEHLAEREGLPRDQAARVVAEIDRNREAFYRRHWPGRALGPEAFTITLNSGELTTEEMVDCVVPILKSRRGHSVADRDAEVTVTGGARPEVSVTVHGGGG